MDPRLIACGVTPLPYWLCISLQGGNRCHNSPCLRLCAGAAVLSRFFAESRGSWPPCNWQVAKAKDGRNDHCFITETQKSNHAVARQLSLI